MLKVDVVQVKNALNNKGEMAEALIFQLLYKLVQPRASVAMGIVLDPLVNNRASVQMIFQEGVAQYS